MILTVAAFLTALGFLSWILGSYFEYPEFAVIGGTVVIVVGSAISLGGLHYLDGETEVEVSNGTTEQISNETSISEGNSTAVSEFEYSPVETQTSFALGNVIMLLGVAMVLRPMVSEGLE